ncbi:uncharacterized protein LOC134037045 [Osmerus eperlanus]|uniref:uncharacterized protein LOC134037045 n=1 Tax=Osmerus eperlanus TaxID=29151 RepID=UPI002E11417D
MYRIAIAASDDIIMQHRQLSRSHGREKTDHEDTAAMLATLPTALWSTGATDVGHCHSVTPITFTFDCPFPYYIDHHQYRHKPEAEAGVADTISGLLKVGVLVPSTSRWNTPILPVPKPGTDKYRMAHDLRRINRIVTTPTVSVPNPYTCMAAVGPQHQWFSCIDLANAFFCLPLAEHLRHMFAFTFQGRKYEYTVLPQGFVLSPGVFNQELRKLLQDVPLPDGVVLLQYVDDLLLVATTPLSCLNATQTVLRHLFNCGFKVSKSKLQCCRRSVTFLGRVISGEGSGVSAAHRSAILQHDKPRTVKDMLSFLGLTGFSRQYVPGYVDSTAPLRTIINAQGMRNLNKVLTWDIPAEEAFIKLKQDLARAAELALPDYTLPFYLDVSETTLSANGVLFQKKEGGKKVLLYLSVMFDNTEKRQPLCTKHAAGVAKLLQKSAHIVMGHPITVLTSHGGMAYINSNMFTLTTNRRIRIDNVLGAPNVTYTHEGINMAEGMTGGEGDSHVCEHRVQKEVKVRPESRAYLNSHGLEHAGYREMMVRLTHWWHPHLPAMVANYVAECRVCQEYNVRPTLKPHQGMFPLPKTPGQEIVIDYTDMINSVRGHRYLLVAVDGYTGWPEAVPTKHEDAKSVCKFLTNTYIPFHGFPKRIRSDNGSHFKNKHLQLVEQSLGLVHAFGAVYHPQSQGKVERMNRNLKCKLAKICATTNMNWVDALPIALAAIRSSVNTSTGFTPYELLTGRQFPGPGAGLDLLEAEGELAHQPYYDQLSALVSSFSKQVQEKRGTAQDPVKAFTAGRWTGPFKVIERTSHALRVLGKGSTWYHWSMCSAAPEPSRTLQELVEKGQEGQ